MNEKHNCIASLSKTLSRTSLWRREISKKYPHDIRNSIASERLSQLADEVLSLTDEQWSQLEPFFNWASEAWNDAVSQSARHVEFHRHVRTLQGFVNDLVAGITESRVER